MATPPFAEPSSFVRTTPVTPTASPKRRACCTPFWPVVASTTSSVSCGAPSRRPASTRRTFASSSIRFVWVWRRPAVSTTTTSRPRATAASTASYATAAGSAPCSEPTKSAPARCAQISSCSSAAARYVSAAATTTERPCSASLAESLPIVVVLPVPLTPTTRTTAGSWATSRTGASPNSSVTSSASAAFRSTSSPRASSRCTSSAVARTPTSPAMSASSSRSQSASSPGSKDAAATSSPVSARRDFESESRSREKKRPPLSSSGSGAASGSPNSCAQLRGELPLLGTDQGHFGSVRHECVDLDFRAADHEVDVDVRDVHPLVRLALEAVRKPEAVGDVTRGVLVEQRVVEELPRLAHARLLRDERELAEPIGVLDPGEVAADDVRAALGLDSDDPPVLECELELTDQLPGEAEWHARAQCPLGAPRIRCGEDLLGRHVRDVLDATGGVEAGAAPARARQQADGEVGSRAAVPERVGPALGEGCGAGVEAIEVLAPGGDGVRLVEPEAEGNELPQLLDVWLVQHLARPAFVRRPDTAPVDALLPVLLSPNLGDLEQHRAADALAVEVGQQLRLGVSRRPQLRIAGRRLRKRLLPLGRVCERLVGTELDHRPPDVLILVHDIHVRRARAVPLPCQRTNELGVLDEAVDEDLLPRLHVCADADGELRVPLEAFVHRAIVRAPPRS